MAENTTQGARVFEEDRSSWTNYHENVTQKNVKKVFTVYRPSGSSTVRGYNETTALLQKLFRRAVNNGVRMRGVGGTWSLSRAAAVDGYVLDTRNLNYGFNISASSVSRDFTGDHEKLFFAQCGANVWEISQQLEARDLSFHTTGASNGQTIVGAISTGTHGSVLDFGGIQDHVVGLHLIVSPTKTIYLERASRPVVSNRFVNNLGAELRRDDDLFNAALVSFGSFGIIHGVMIEATDIFLMNTHSRYLTYNAALKHTMDTLDFSNLPKLPRENVRPYFFKLVVNPHNMEDGVYTKVSYKEPFTLSHPIDYSVDGSGIGPGDDLLNVMGSITDNIPLLTPALVNLLARLELPSTEDKREGITGTVGQTFGFTNTRGTAVGAAMGIPLSETSRAVDLFLDLFRTEEPAPLVIGIRYVKKSDATLAFTRFDTTCVIELDGVASKRSTDFFKKAWKAMDDAGIPYTQHWGKVNNLNRQRVRTAYGSSVDNWIEARQSLLSESGRRVFSSPFLDKLGLSD